MKKGKIILIGIILVASLACRFLTPEMPATETPIVFTEARIYENEAFSFTIPAGWRTMEEVWERPMQPGRDFYGLGVEEVIQIQYPPEKGQGNTFFTVATSALAGGEDLESRFTQAYEKPVPEMEDVSKQIYQRGKLSGFEISYRRPWGEPWWQFHDIWLEKDAVIYVVSFQADPNAFGSRTETFDQILDSFRFND